MPCSESNRSLARLQRSASPTITGTMCVSLGSSGSPAAASARLVVATLRCCASRSACDPLRWRIEVTAAAAIAGGSAVVKMNPGAYERTVSTMARLAAM